MGAEQIVYDVDVDHCVTDHSRQDRSEGTPRVADGLSPRAGSIGNRSTDSILRLLKAWLLLHSAMTAITQECIDVVMVLLVCSYAFSYIARDSCVHYRGTKQAMYKAVVHIGSWRKALLWLGTLLERFYNYSRTGPFVRRRRLTRRSGTMRGVGWIPKLHNKRKRYWLQPNSKAGFAWVFVYDGSYKCDEVL